LNRRPPNGLQVWQPFRGRSQQDWYRGTADAIYQNRAFIQDAKCDTLLILSGDHIYINRITATCCASINLKMPT
jgi:glucose-1-phosphate adenylyltransferase